MHFIVWFWLTLMTLSFIISVHALFLRFEYKKNNYYRLVSAIGANIFLWITCRFIMQTSGSDSVILFFHELKYIAILSVPSLLYFYSYSLVHGERAPFKVRFTLSMLPLPILFLILTNPFHHFFRGSLSVIKLDRYVLVATENNFLYYIMILLVYSILFASLLNFIRAYRNQPSTHKYIESYLLVGMSVPIIFNISYHIGAVLFNINFDPTPIGFFIGLVMFYRVLITNRANHAVLVNRGIMIDYMDEAILFLNHNQLIIDANKQILELADVPIKALYDRPLNSFDNKILSTINQLNENNNDELDFTIIVDNKEETYRIKQKDVYSEKQIYLGTLFILYNITDYMHIKNDLYYMTNHDPLTGLYNRHYFNKQVKEYNDIHYFPLGLCYCTIKDLKYINEHKGHKAGDLLLVNTASSIKKLSPNKTVVCRTGSDEFALLIPNTSTSEMNALTQSIYQLFDNELLVSFAIKTDIAQQLNAFKSEANNPTYTKK